MLASVTVYMIQMLVVILQKWPLTLEGNNLGKIRPLQKISRLDDNLQFLEKVSVASSVVSKTKKMRQMSRMKK